MKNLFEHTSSPWIRYSSYEYRTAEDGTLYIVVSADAKPEMYNPMKDAESLVLDAVNIGLQVMHKAPEDELKSMVLRFINSYGFLGFMTALPTTAEFITYESVYLPKNHFIKEESLSTESYLDYFYPFDKMDFHKKGVESSWSVSDKDGIAIALATGKNPHWQSAVLKKLHEPRKNLQIGHLPLPQVSYIIWTTTVLMNRQKTCIVRVCLHLAAYPRLTISH